jgi:hypothetical protein
MHFVKDQDLSSLLLRQEELWIRKLPLNGRQITVQVQRIRDLPAEAGFPDSSHTGKPDNGLL